MILTVAVLCCLAPLVPATVAVIGPGRTLPLLSAHLLPLTMALRLIPRMYRRVTRLWASAGTIVACFLAAGPAGATVADWWGELSLLTGLPGAVLLSGLLLVEWRTVRRRTRGLPPRVPGVLSRAALFLALLAGSLFSRPRSSRCAIRDPARR